MKTLRDWIAKIDAFLNNKNNPTNVTAEQAGAYDKATIDRLVSEKMSVRDSPVSFFGQGTAEVVDIVPGAGAPMLNSSYPFILNGIRGIIAPGLLEGYSAAGRYNVYLDVSSGKGVITSNINYVPESNTLAWLGFVDWDGTKPTARTVKTFIKLGLYRLAIGKQGSSIPVASGAPNTEGTFPW